MISYMISAWIIGYDGIDPISVGFVGAIITMIFIITVIEVANLRYRFEWWNQTYCSSFMFTGVWIVLISSVIYLLENKPSDPDKKKQIVVIAGGVSVLLVIIEFFIVLVCKCFCLSSFYFIGYSSTVKDPDLQRYFHRGDISSLLDHPDISYEHPNQNFSVDDMVQT